MKVRSKLHSGATQITRDKTKINVVSSLIEDGNDDLFSNDIDSSLWAETASNITKTTTGGKLKIDFGAGASVYDLTTSYNLSQDNRIWFKFGCSYNKTGSTSGDVIVQRFLADDGSTSYSVEFIVNDSDPSPKIVVKSGGTTVKTYEIDSHVFECYVGKDDDDWVVVTVDNGSVELVHASTRAFTADYTVTLRSEDPASTGSVEYRPYSELPMLKGLVSKGYGNLPLPVRKQGSNCDYIVEPYAPGNFELTLYGIGSQAASTETYDSLTVLAEYVYPDEIEFLSSDVDNFSYSGEQSTLCPTQGVPDEENKGNLILNNSCFCDGSDRNTDALGFEFIKTGENSMSEGSSNRSEYIVEDGGVKYGNNFDFLRIHHPDNSLTLDTAGERLVILKMLQKEDGGRIYYGIAKPTDSAQNIHVEFTYDFSDEQIADILTNIDEFYWELYDEDEQLIQSATDDPITYSNNSASGNLFGHWDAGSDYSSLDPGRYRLRIIARGKGNSEYGDGTGDDGASIRAVVRQGTTSSDPIIAEGFAESKKVVDDSSAIRESNYGICDIHFQVKERRGRLVLIDYDVCNKTISKIEASTLEVDTRSNSVAAIESGDNIILLFQKSVDDDFYANKSGVINYLKYDGASFTDSGQIQTPNWTRYIHSFDAYSDGDTLHMYCSVCHEEDYGEDEVFNDIGYKVSVERSKPSEPFGPRGIQYYGLPLDDVDFDSSRYTSRNMDRNQIVLKSLSSMFAKQPDMKFHYERNSYETDKFYKWDLPDTIRLDWNRELDLVVVSVIDMNTRCPVILMGRGAQLKEISIPFHFDLYADAPIVPDHVDRERYKIDSFSAALSSDGVIYSVCTQDEVCELGINDPSFFYVQRDLLVIPEFDEFIGGNYDVYTPKTRFEAILFHGEDTGDATSDKIEASIHSSFHYLVSCMQNSAISNQPNIVQNGFYDTIPFQTFSEYVWNPERQDTGDAVTVQNQKSYDDDKLQIENLNSATSEILITLDRDKTYKDRFFYVDEGYKVHARIEVDPIPGDDNTTHPAIFHCTFHKNADTPYYKVEARFLIYGSTIEAEIYNYSNSAWENVKTWTNQAAGVRPLDFYILVQSPGESAYGKAVFIIKDPVHIQSVVKGLGRMDFQTTSQYAREVDFRIDDADNNDFSEFGVKFDTNTTGADIAEEAFIYHLGFNTLVADTGMAEQASLEKPPGSGNNVDTYNSRHLPGERQYAFDDSKIYEYNDVPQYGFKPGIEDNESRSGAFHWWNGFNFHWSGRGAYRSDSYDLARQVVNPVSDILPRKLHGIWISKDDSSQEYISSDANSDSLEEYTADTFIVKGANVRWIDVVGKDAPGDPWTDIGTIDFVDFLFESCTVDQNGTEVILECPNVDLHSGYYRKNPGYLYSKTDAQFLKIVDNHGSVFKCQAKEGETFSSGDYEYIQRNGVLTLDEPVERRFIGFEIPAQNTYEGRFYIYKIDFGKRGVLPEFQSYDEGGGRTLDFSIESSKYFDSQVYKFSGDRQIVPNYDLSYETAGSETFIRLKSMFEFMNTNRKPFWVLVKKKDKYVRADLCLLEGDLAYDLYRDEEGELIHTINLTPRGVSE